MLYPNDNYFEKYDKAWYIHPLLKSYACTTNGYVIYKQKRVLKPKFRKFELYIRVLLSGKLQWYSLKNFIYESMHYIPEVPLVKRIDGNILNNSISNLALMHIRYIT